MTSRFTTSFLLLPHKFFKGTHRNPKAVLAKSRSVVICLCFRILFGRSFRNQIDSLGKQTLLTLSLPEWMMEFVRWFFLLRLWTKSCGATIQMKSLWKYFHVVLFVFKNFTKWNLGVLSNLPLVVFGSERVKMTTTGPQWCTWCILLPVYDYNQHQQQQQQALFASL